MRLQRLKFAILALLTITVLPGGWALAQSGEPDHAANPSAQNAPVNAAPEQKSEEDPTAQFKHSASVRLLSRITG